jgi:NadR type nicotinamide-nucleotide adenylyltransferase
MHTKQYKTGLVIGKFLPLHKGHIALMNEAANRVDELTVIVCQTDVYNISSEIRKKWIENEFPTADVRILIHDKELDSTSTKISKKWAEITEEFLGFSPEAVFSSESYGVEYAKWLGAEHIMYDPERKNVPISATEIRTDPYRYWEMLNEDVKSYYAKRIVVLGAESTGTTTLAMDLAKKLKTVWVPEYGRMYYEANMFSEPPLVWEESDFVHISQMQNKMEDELAGKCRKVLVCDTDSFATSVWYTRYVGGRSEKVESLSNERTNDLYILTDIDIPFIQDGTRDGEHIREWMHGYFVERLKETGRNFIIVSESREKRVKDSIKAIKKFLK